MSLQVWLPLNGDLHNQGLSGLTATNNGATVNNNGKIGKCYQLGTAASDISLPAAAMNSYTTECSISFWIDILTWNTNYATFFQAGPAGTVWTSYIFGFLRNNAASTCCFTISNGSSASNTSYLTPALDLNKWYHISLVYKTGHCLIYVNGSLYKDYTTSIVPNFTNITTIKIGRSTIGSSYQTNCLINDFRIYDHALSAAEAAEIAKGLILHYKLDNNGLGNENYWANGKPQFNTWINFQSYPKELRATFARTNANYTSSPSTIPNEYTEVKFLSTREQVDNGFIQLQKIQRYNNTYNGMCPILENLKEGEYFTISYEFYTSSPVQVNFGISKRIGTTYKKHIGASRFQVSTINTWTKISQSIQVTSDFDKSNITADVDYLSATISIIDVLGVTTPGEVVMRIRNIKLEKGQEVTSWTPARADFGHIDDNIIYDYSGYGNNGTIVGELTAAAGSPRYQVCTHFNGVDNCIITPYNQIVPDNIFTLNFWFHKDALGSKGYETLFGGPSGFEMDTRYGSSSTLGLYMASHGGNVFSPFSLNTWYMITMVRDGTNEKYYVNGDLKKTIEAKSMPTGTYRIGAWNSNTGQNFYGNMSDFRIYTTVLSAEQIKDLFHTSMSIDANGNVHARELIEL